MPRLRSVRCAAGLLAVILFIAGCDSTQPDDDAGEQELISDVTLTLQGASETITATAVFREDGSRDDDASALRLSLTPGTTYAGTVAFTNRFAGDPDERDVTAEVRAEAREHQVFYVAGGEAANAIELRYDDVETDYTADADDPAELRDTVPVGLRFTLTVDDRAAAGTAGSLQVILGHYDEGKRSDETLSAATERDVDTTFEIVLSDQS